MTAIRNLCGGAIWLDRGTVHAEGNVVDTVDSYLLDGRSGQSITRIDESVKSLPDDSVIRIESVSLRQNGMPTTIVLNGLPLDLEVTYEVFESTIGLRVYFDLLDSDQNILVRTFHDDDADRISTMKPGKYVSVAQIPAHFLAPQPYEIRLRATIHNVRQCTGPGIGIPLSVERTGSVNRAYSWEPIRSRLLPAIPWHTKQLRGGYAEDPGSQ